MDARTTHTRAACAAAVLLLASGAAFAAQPAVQPADQPAAQPAERVAALPDELLTALVDDADEGQRPEVSIPFADRGGIRDWRVVDRDTLLIEGTSGRWYRAELFTYCFELPFAHRIGFRTGPTGAFDRTSSLIVRGERCALRSLTETAQPPKRTAKDRDAGA